jgi:hypothetical protein
LKILSTIKIKFLNFIQKLCEKENCKSALIVITITCIASLISCCIWIIISLKRGQLATFPIGLNLNLSTGNGKLTTENVASTKEFKIITTETANFTSFQNLFPTENNTMNTEGEELKTAKRVYVTSRPDLSLLRLGWVRSIYSGRLG